MRTTADIVNEIIDGEIITTVVVKEHNGDILVKESHLKGGSILHRNDGPAYIEYDLKGDFIKRVWYQNGQIYRDNDEPAWIETNKKTGEFIKKWYQNGKIHRDNDEPAINIDVCQSTIKKWYKEGIKYRDDNKPYKVEYFTDVWSYSKDPTTITYKKYTDHTVKYKLTSKKIEEIRWFNDKRELHKEDGPALIRYDDKGIIKEEHWYQNGVRHKNDNKPAVIIYSYNKPLFVYHFKEGIFYNPDIDKTLAHFADSPGLRKSYLDYLKKLQYD